MNNKKKINICILKGQESRHNYFANELLKVDANFLIIAHNRVNVERLKKMIFHSPVTFFNRVSKYIFYYLIGWNKKERLFFGNIKLEQTNVDNLNSDQSINIIKEFKPDLILVFGTPILSKKIIDIPKYGSVNLHGGISPLYRGGNTIFWPLFKGDLMHIGATIHYMVEKVDSGHILSRVYPEINETDNEFSLTAKSVKMATTVVFKLVEFVIKNESAPQGSPQNSDGKLYLAKERTLIKDIQGLIRIKFNLRGVHIDQRLERFF